MGWQRCLRVVGVKVSWAVRGSRGEGTSLNGGSAPGTGGVECGRGGWNLRSDGGMCSYREDHQRRRQVPGTLLTLMGESVGSEQD